MPASVIALIVTAAAVLIFSTGLRYLLPWVLDRDEALPAGAVHSMDILDRLAAEGSLRTDPWQLEPAHRAPIDPYTPEQAHKVMQHHRECAIELCAAKYSAAYWALVDAGHAVPDIRVAR